MPVRTGGESDEEARRRRRPEPLGVPPKTDPLGLRQLKEPPLTSGQRAEQETLLGSPAPIAVNRRPPSTATPTTTLPKEPFEFVPWAPEQQTVLDLEGDLPLAEKQQAEFFAPEFDVNRAAQLEFIKFVQHQESIGDSDSSYAVDLNLDGSSVEEMNGYYASLFLTLKNLEAVIPQVEEYDPEFMKTLARSREKLSYGEGKEFLQELTPQAEFLEGFHYDTLDPMQSLVSARDEIAREHPDDLAQYLSSDEGRLELAANAEVRMLTPIDHPSTLEKVVGLFTKSRYSTASFGEDINFAEPLTNQIPDHPALNILTGTLNTLGDPLFITASLLFPPAGLAQKARLATEIAVSLELGAEGAESVGLPPIVGAIPAALLGPIGAEVGFSRAAMKAGTLKARFRPVRGEPATETLIDAGMIAGDFRALRTQFGETFGPPGTKVAELKLSPVEAQQGRHTLVATNAEGTELGRIQWRLERGIEGEGPALHVADVVVQTEKQGIGSGLLNDVLDQASAGGIKRVTGDLNSESGIRLFNRFGAKFTDLRGNKFTMEGAITARAKGIGVQGEIDVAALPERFTRDVTVAGKATGGTLADPLPVSGARTGPDIAGFRRKIFAHIERPEARDGLRLIAGKVKDFVPGLGKGITNAINRMATADEPALKAAFGWWFQEAEDVAARFMTLGAFKGAGGRTKRALPFLENQSAQVWVPKQPQDAGRLLNLLHKGDGDWISFGDVFESVMKGEKTYLKRLNGDQIAFIKQANEAMAPYVSFAERATGEQIAKKEFHWPRYVIDPNTKAWMVSAGTKRGKPSFLFQREFELQQEAITQFGIKYKPGIFNQMDGQIEALQRMTRDALLGRYLREEGVTALAKKGPNLNQVRAEVLAPGLKGVISKTNAAEIARIIGPRSQNPVLTVPGQINGIARLMLTGSLDVGWGALQLVTLIASPAGPAAWAKAMTKGFYNALIEPKQFYRWMVNSPAARKYGIYGGDLGMSSELMEAARTGGLGIPRILKGPSIAGTTVVDAATFIPRTFINRLQVGFDASLAYGRVMAFDAMADVATKPGLLERVQGIKALSGGPLHDELFRLARFADTLIGSPKLGGIISGVQHQVESGFVFFATRYTRSLLGTLAYTFGKGATPAMARTTMAKLVIGGMSIMAGSIGALGAAKGHSPERILDDIATALNPASGKKFMSMNIAGDWYGLGGVYRSAIAVIGGLANKENWEFDTWEEGLYQNPMVRAIRGRTAPLTGQIVNLGPSLFGLMTGQNDVEGTDFMGYPVNISEFVDHPEKFWDYGLKNFAPITLDALLDAGGGGVDDWKTSSPRFLAEFFGLRTSPETAWEALEPVLNKVSQDSFGVPYDELENNLVAQDYVRNTEKVIAVTDGRVRPVREREKERFWRKYREDRETIRAPHEQSRQRIEDIYTSGRMDGRQYREEYGDERSAEYFELRGMQASLEEEFDLAGKEDAPVGTVNYALDRYYSIDLDLYRDKDTGVPDWEAFFSDRDAAIALVPEEFQDLVGTWLNRRETEVRQHMRNRFESVIQKSGYLRVREAQALMLGVSLDDLEGQIVESLQKSGFRATPGDVAKKVDEELNIRMKGEFGEDAPSISTLRNAIREANPSLDAELFRQGFVSTVRSVEALQFLDLNNEIWPEHGYFRAPIAGDIIKKLGK